MAGCADRESGLLHRERVRRVEPAGIAHGREPFIERERMFSTTLTT